MQGPEIRTGLLEGGQSVDLVKDEILELSKYKKLNNSSH